MSSSIQWLGATHLGGEGTKFRVWAPGLDKVDLHLVAPSDRVVSLEKDDRGCHQALVEGVGPAARYFYRLEGGVERPDPASRFQPEGVHKSSAVVNQRFEWSDDGWFGLPLRDYVVYELHVGTFTGAGTFEAIIPHLEQLKELGVTAVELMPVAQFPGSRNWGYDGVYPFAVQDSYGGPEGLKRLVNAAHAIGLAVILDVVYNHLGPEGNYLGAFGPYFTDHYRTPWGTALNFDGEDSGGVREYFNQNALYWQTEFHLDALRLDAIHAICDYSAVPFLQELAVATQSQSERLNRRFYLIAESDLNDVRIILPRAAGGYGLDGQWSDDFHHALHVLLTGEKTGYYEDFGGLSHLAKVWGRGYAYAGDYSRHRRRRHGNSPDRAGVKQFVVCSQNHDQVGNRMLGERLSVLVKLEELKLAAGAVLLSPSIPMLFMGEEYGETAPFQFFTSHSDPGLIQAVREGRSREFAAFKWEGKVPDPDDRATFEASKLDWKKRERGDHQVLRGFYAELISLRKGLRVLAEAEKERMEVLGLESEEVLLARYWGEDGEVLVVCSFGKKPVVLERVLGEGVWEKRLDSAEAKWGGPGALLPDRVESNGRVSLKLPPRSVAVLERCNKV